MFLAHPAQNLGMVLPLAISGSLFHNVAVDKVGKALPEVSTAEIGNLIARSSSEAFEALSNAEKALVIPEIASAITSIWNFFLAAAALSVVCSVPLVVGCLPTTHSSHFCYPGDAYDRELNSVVVEKLRRRLQR